MKAIITVCLKELKKFFTDRRMLVSLFLPGILIFVIYSIMGDALLQTMDTTNTEYNVIVENEPLELQPFLRNEEMIVNVIQNTLSQEEINQKLQNKEIDLYIHFEEDFMNKVINYNIDSNKVAPSIEIYYNSTSMSSSTIYSYYITVLDTFESSLSNKFDINKDITIKYDVVTESDMTKEMMTMMLPLLLLIFLFTSSMGICADSIAGEKERGTIATLLITPAKRSSIILGKVIAAGITSLASAVVSFLGLFFSLPKLTGTSFELGMYDLPTFILLFLIIIVTVLLFTTLLTCVSTYAKSVKEASTLSVPLMMVVMLVGLGNFMSTSVASNPTMYLIPIYNTVQCLIQLFSMSINPITFIICIISNTVYIGIAVVLLTRLFDNEKIIFN